MTWNKLETSYHELSALVKEHQEMLSSHGLDPTCASIKPANTIGILEHTSGLEVVEPIKRLGRSILVCRLDEKTELRVDLRANLLRLLSIDHLTSAHAYVLSKYGCRLIE